jgi:hypothetical protein
MRVGRQLCNAHHAAAHSGNRRRRRDAGRRCVHQRAIEGAWPRPLLPSLRIDFSRRTDDDRSTRRAARADPRLAGDVSDWRRSRPDHRSPPASIARISTLVDRQGSIRGGGCGNSRDQQSGIRDPKIEPPNREPPNHEPTNRRRVWRSSLARSIAAARRSSGRSGPPRISSPTD